MTTKSSSPSFFTAREKQILLFAIGCAVEHLNRALENCEEACRGGGGAELELAIRERQQMLKDLFELRRRIAK